MVHMEVKLGTHVYLSVSMTTIDKKLPQAPSPVTTVFPQIEASLK